MQDLYRRLKAVGFNKPYVRGYFLPDWWDDKLATVPMNRAIAEATVAKQLGLRIEELRDVERALSLPAAANFRLKRNRNVEAADLLPAMQIGQRVAHLVAESLPNLPPFTGGEPADGVRRAVIAKHPRVSLDGLVSYCWGRGVIVLHVARLPPDSKKFDGLALFCGDRPVIVLASARTGPAWLAFHLAHELGHLLLGHVKPGDAPLVDADVSQVDDDDQEDEADEFGCAVLTGQESPDLDWDDRLDGVGVAQQARDVGDKRKIDPGTLALCYGRISGRWNVAGAALKALDADKGAQDIVARQVKLRLGELDLSESLERFLGILS